MKIRRDKFILVLILIVSLVGLLLYSFSFTTVNHTGTENNYLAVSDIVFSLSDSVNSISLGNLTPTIDKFGLENESFSFSISNTDSTAKNYTVRLVDYEIKSTIPNNEIHYQLSINNSAGIIRNLSDNGVIDSGTLNSGASINYSIKVWLGYESVTQNGIWSKVVSAEAGATNIDKSGANEPILLDNMIPSYYDETNEIWRKADATNSNINHEWYDYDDKRWANAVSVMDDKRIVADKTGNILAIPNGGVSYNNNNAVFDGVNDYLDLGLANYEFGTSVSFVLRFKKMDSSLTSLFDNFEGAGVGMEVNSDNELYFLIHNNVNYQGIGNKATIVLSTWYTAVGTYDGSNLKLYLNGALMGSVPVTGEVKQTPARIIIGGNAIASDPPGADSFANMEVSNAMIYTDALTETEVSNNFAGEISTYPTDNLLVNYDKFEEKGKRDYYLNSSLGTPLKMEDVTSMWVWIPRFKYTLFNAGALEKEINVSFERGTNSTGTLKCSHSSLGVETCEDLTHGQAAKDESTYTHPAFKFGDEELTGLWISKFSVSPDSNTTPSSICYNSISSANCDKDTLNIVSKPNSKSLVYTSIGNLFKNIRKMELNGNIHGFSNTSSTLNSDGIITDDSNEFDIHLSRQMELSSLTYLSYSKYGKMSNLDFDDKDKTIFAHNSTTSTGKSFYGTQESEYNVPIYGTGASTTGNVYGVYDLNVTNDNGTQLYTMGNFLKADGSINSASSGLSVINGKYWDAYPHITTNVTANKFKTFYGDGISEFYNWSNKYLFYVDSTTSFIVHYGITDSSNASGGAYRNIGGIAVIAPYQDVYITKW